MPGITKSRSAWSKRPVYMVGNRAFCTKADVTAFVREILYRSTPGAPLALADQQFMLALLAYHKSAAQKIGPGVRCVTVETNPDFPSNRGFWLSRLDGSRTDFSFIECISPAPPILALKAAMRREVLGQVLAVKNALFDATPVALCPITGEEMHRDDNCHVDHEPPATFDAIAQEFIAAENLRLEAVSLTEGDGVVSQLLVDRLLAERWKAFHAARARLRVVSIRANLSVIGRGK